MSAASGNAQESAQLSPKQVKALAALMSEATYAKAAQTAGIAESTLRSWLRNDSSFIAAFQQATDDVIAAASFKGEKSLALAMDTLTAICESSTAADSCRIAAARSLLEYGLKLSEHYSVIRRIEILEASSNA